MTDNRYTVDDPPSANTAYTYTPTVDEGNAFGGWIHNDARLLALGLLHRTPESAEAHAKRMIMVDDILNALEFLLDEMDAHYAPRPWYYAWRVVERARGRPTP